jgi:hypothetical protein
MSDEGDKKLLAEVEDLRRQKYIWTFAFFHACEIHGKVAKIAFDLMSLIEAMLEASLGWVVIGTEGEALRLKTARFVTQEMEKLKTQLKVLAGQ